MICYEDIIFSDIKTCGNYRCSFKMCTKCLNNLETIACPNCRQTIEGKIIETDSDTESVQRRVFITNNELIKHCPILCFSTITMQIPFSIIGIAMTYVTGLPVTYACYMSNIPLTMYTCYKIQQDRSSQRDMEAPNAELIIDR